MALSILLRFFDSRYTEVRLNMNILGLHWTIEMLRVHESILITTRALNKIDNETKACPLGSQL